MTKRLLASVAAAIGCMGAHAELLRIDLVGSIQSYESGTPLVADNAKIGTTMSLSFTYDLGTVSPLSATAPGVRTYYVTSSVGCPSVGPLGCLQTRSGGALLQAVSASFGGSTYDLATEQRGRALPMLVSGELSKSQQAPNVEAIQSSASQVQGLLGDMNAQKFLSSIQTYWGFYISDNGPSSDWLGAIDDFMDLPSNDLTARDFAYMTYSQYISTCTQFATIGGVERCQAGSRTTDSFLVQASVTGASFTILDANAVHEPGSLALLGVALGGLALWAAASRAPDGPIPVAMAPARWVHRARGALTGTTP